MKKYAKLYINSIINNLPVAMFFFTIMFTLNILGPYEGFKAEHGMEALDVFVGIYLHYFYRTILITVLISFYGFVFLWKRLKYSQMILIHAILTIGSVVIVFNPPGSETMVSWLVLSTGIIIYAIVWFFIKYKERQFVHDANEILNKNIEEKPE